MSNNSSNKSQPSSLPQQQQQQQQVQEQESLYNEQEECLSAQRAAMEAIHVGRATVEQAQMQHEQLTRADNLADETQYKLDKAGRVLRGMESWGGWIANKFSKDVAAPLSASIQSHLTAAPSGKVGSHDSGIVVSGDNGPKIYENLPDACQPTAQAIQNYHLNVQVLEQCLDEEQKETCGIICQDMYRIASQQLEKLKSSSSDQAKTNIEAYWIPLEQDLELLRKRQVSSLQRIRFNNTNNNNIVPPSSALTSTLANAKESKPTGSPSKSPPLSNKIGISKDSNIKEDASTIRLQQQDEHLNVLGQALGELSHIAKSLNQSMEAQNETMDSLHEKSDNMLVKVQLNTRRADRLIQNKSWQAAPAPTFTRNVTIRHVATGKYLAAVQGDLYLLPTVNPRSCIFGLYTTPKGRIVGFKNKCTDRWAGQSLFGSLVCTASNFGRREEWEADSDEKDDNGEKHWNRTRLLCASAGWGAGGYLTMRVSDFAILLSAGTAEDRNKADFWCIQERND